MVTLAGNLNASTSTSKVLQSQSGFTTSSGVNATAGTDLNDLSQTLTDLANGDVINFDITLNDGTTSTITHTYAAGDTLGDMVDSFNAGLTASEGELSLIDGVLNLRSATMGESELNLSNVSITGTGQINFPGMQTLEEGQTNKQTMSTTVYDDLGKAHSLLLEFTQTGTNEWQYDARFLDGENITNGASGMVQFDELGQLSSDDLLNLTFEPGQGASTTSFSVELGDSAKGTRFTQYAGANSAKVISQDGYTQGQLIDVAIDGAGQVQGIYDNGNSMVLAQLALAQVQNQNGLEMIGGGMYRATSAAGEMFVNTADSFAGTAINAGNLEGSNVDLAKEFTNMITSQRAYQSNARVITTSDEMLTEAVNLKR
jgi:flagellar hook protein FlgE